MSAKKTYFLVLIFSILFLVGHSQEKPIAIVIHGGAGTILKKNMTPEQERTYNEKLGEALDAGYEILKKGGSSLDAIEASIKILEDSPLFNAGKGAVFTADGRNELDASIMDGSNLKAGAVAGVRTVKNPIVAARRVMDSSPHVLMAGKGAETFAMEKQVEMVDTSYFFDEKRFRQLQRLQEEEKKKEQGQGFIFPLPVDIADYKFGTVGAVALDRNGNLAAGTSTGGMSNKRYGRIGDSPIIGAGTYANNNTCAISATGHGEYFIRSVVAYDVSALMEYRNLSLNDAAHRVVMLKLKEMGGEGGIIGVDKNGNITMTFNSEGMFRGAYDNKGRKTIAIYRD
jgi:L-asparaginase / beta-aspartyl-peptidase